MTQAVAPLGSPSKGAAAKSAQHSLLASYVPPSGNNVVVTQKQLADNCGFGSASGRAWVAVYGNVFDITEFMQAHPGGPMIRLAAGRDAECLIESYHPLSSIVKVEAALFTKARYVGQLQAEVDASEKRISLGGAVPARKRPDDAFFLDVRARVDALITRELRSSRYAYDTIGLVESVLTFLVYCYAMYMVGVHGSWPWTLALGLLTGRMGFLMHMGNHCGISGSPTVNKWVGWFHNLIGSDALIWGYEHQVAHHVEPNEYKRDNDCEIGAPSVRMHPDIPHTALMRWQHIAIPIAMTVGFFKWYVGDFGHFVAKQVGNVRMAIDSRDWLLLLGFKSLWLVLHVAIPVYFCGWGTAMAQLFVFMGLGGHYLENIFIVNHIQNGLVPPAGAHWAAKQVMATANWASGSKLWNWVSGGLNHQIEHHMFPSLSFYWYPRIAPVVQQACEDHGLPYANYPSFGEAWMDMWRYLRDLGDPNFVAKDGRKGAPPEAAKKSA